MTEKTLETVKSCMESIDKLNESHGVKTAGAKKYTQVVHRMEAFRKHFGFEYTVMTEIVVDDGKRVVMVAKILNREGMIVGTGHAEEIRGQGPVNRTSALENCETSAIGRALSAIGLSGGEYASANEMDGVERKSNAMAEQVKQANVKK